MMDLEFIGGVKNVTVSLSEEISITICYFLLRINGITRNNKNKIIRIRFITSCPYYV